MPSDPIRVAIVCDYSLGYLGGAQTALLQQAAALADAGAIVTVISPSPVEVWRRVRPHARVAHVTVPARVTLPGLDLPVLRNTAALRRRLATLFAQRAVDVVHLQAEFGLAAASIAAARGLGIPVVHTVHTFFWRGPDAGQPAAAAAVAAFHRWISALPSPRERLAERPADSALRNMTLAVARRADLVVSPSAHQAEQLRAAGVPRVQVVPNTVRAAPEDAAPIARVEGRLEVAWIGRCVPEKRILPFVDAALRTAARLGNGAVRFTVAGDGSQLEEARRLAASSEAVRFLGRVDHERIERLLAGSHLLALTSRGFDNQPMTIVEAVMALRGVVYCDPALREGLDGPGILSGESAAELADTFVALAQHPERVVAASAAAVRAREAFTPAQHAATVLALYRSLR